MRNAKLVPICVAPDDPHARAVGDALDTAFRASPRRFKGLRPTPGKLPTAVWINPPAPEIVTTQTPSPCTVNS